MPPEIELHPLIVEAADGILPEWACAGRRRREHMARVAKLMRKWAKARALESSERTRWKAAAWFHDAQRDQRPASLRRELGDLAEGIPGGALHGHATALRLEQEGVNDPDLIEAVRMHTVGRPGLPLIGRALRAADFLEPGRRDRDGARKALRELALTDLEAATQAVEIARRNFQGED